MNRIAIVFLFAATLFQQGCFTAAWIAAVGADSMGAGDVRFQPFEASWVSQERATAVADPTAIPLGAGPPSHVFHRAPEWRRRRRRQAEEPQDPGRLEADGIDRGGAVRVGKNRGLPGASAGGLARVDLPILPLGRGRETSSGRILYGWAQWRLRTLSKNPHRSRTKGAECGQSVSSVGMPGCGTRPLRAPLTRGIFRRDSSPACHECSWGLETGESATFRHPGDGHGAWHPA